MGVANHKSGQVRIIRAGAEVFAFDTINWPDQVYPIVYTAWAMTEDCIDSKRLGWKWITREQFEWVVKHQACMVSYVGAGEIEHKIFYCMNHNCWEKEGADFSALTVPEKEIIEPYFEADLDEERKV